jgi:hypothetical protein
MSTPGGREPPRMPRPRRICPSWHSKLLTGTSQLLSRKTAARPGQDGYAAVRLADGGSWGGMGADEHLAGRGEPCVPAALADRLFRDMAGALELLTVYVGERLGLYRALHADGPATSAELAARTGTTERPGMAGAPCRERAAGGG